MVKAGVRAAQKVQIEHCRSDNLAPVHDPDELSATAEVLGWLRPESIGQDYMAARDQFMRHRRAVELMLLALSNGDDKERIFNVRERISNATDVSKLWGDDGH